MLLHCNINTLSTHPHISRGICALDLVPCYWELIVIVFICIWKLTSKRFTLESVFSEDLEGKQYCFLCFYFCVSFYPWPIDLEKNLMSSLVWVSTLTCVYANIFHKWWVCTSGGLTLEAHSRPGVFGPRRYCSRAGWWVWGKSSNVLSTWRIWPYLSSHKSSHFPFIF